MDKPTPQILHAIIFAGRNGGFVIGDRCTSRQCAVNSINPFNDAGEMVLGRAELLPAPVPAHAYWKANGGGQAPGEEDSEPAAGGVRGFVERLRDDAEAARDVQVEGLLYGYADELESLLNQAPAVQAADGLVPSKRLPEDGNGDDDAYNAGWNACREAMLSAAPAAPAAPVADRSRFVLQLIEQADYLDKRAGQTGPLSAILRDAAAEIEKLNARAQRLVGQLENLR